MFKGLKSKLEDEAKKLQATVAQYGENLAQQVRTHAEGGGGGSDAGSDRGSSSGRGRRLFGSSPGSAVSNQTSPTGEHTNSGLADKRKDRDGEMLVDFESPIAEQPRAPALMQEVDERDLFGSVRVRRSSGGSVDSVDSSMASFWTATPSLSANRLTTIQSDSESMLGNDQESTAGSSFIHGASKEQISSVLHKLQGRAATYKDKYRELVKNYNEVVRENDKCRTVLAQTQDKALQRVTTLRDERRALAEKLRTATEQIEELQHKKMTRQESLGSEERVKRLEELLVKCKETITQKNDRIQELNDTVKQLETRADGLAGEDAISQLTTDRLTSEWKGRMDRLEEQWVQRLAEAEERNSLSLAKTKAEMHTALQERDELLETARAKCRQLETNVVEADVRASFEKKIEDLNKAVTSMEAERLEMVEKLSQAKQRGVMLIKEEEEQRRAELEADFKKQREFDTAEKMTEIDKIRAAHAEQLESMEIEWRNRLREVENQLKLSLSEREMQNVAAVEQSQIRDLEAEIEQLKTEKSQLEMRLNRLSANSGELEQLTAVNEAATQRHRKEITDLIAEHEDILGRIRIETDKQTASYEAQLTKMRSELKSIMENLEKAEETRDSLQANVDNLEHKQRQMLNDHEYTVEELRSQLAEFEQAMERATERLQVREKEMTELMEEYSAASDQLDELRREVATFKENRVRELDESNKGTEEQQMKLDDQHRQIAELTEERDALMIELNSAKELSQIHEHLRVELAAIRETNDTIERQLMEERNRREAVEKHLEKLHCETVEKPLVDLFGDDAAEDEHQKQVEYQRLIARIYELKKEATGARDVLEQRMQSLNSEVDQYKSDCVQLQEANMTLQSSLEQLENEKNELIGLSKQLKDELEISREQRNLLEKQLENARIELTGKTEAIEAKELDNERLEAMLTDKEEKETILSEKLRQLERRLAETSLQADELQKTLVEERTAGSSVSTDRESLLQQLENKINSQMTEIRELLARNDNLEKKLSENEAVREQMEKSRVAMLETEQAERGSEIEQLKMELSSLNTRLSEAVSLADERKEQLDNLQTQFDELQIERVSLVDELCATKEERDGLLEEKEYNDERNKQIEAERDQLKKELTAKLAELERITKEQVTIREQYATALENVRTALTKAEDRARQFDEATEEAIRLRSKIETLTTDYEHLKQDSEKAVMDVRRKAEVKFAKLKKQNETDMQAGKAELLLQLDEQRTRLMEQDDQLAQLRGSLNKAEQRLSNESDNAKALTELRDVKQKLEVDRDRNIQLLRQAQTETADLQSRCENAERLTSELQTRLDASASLHGEMQKVQAELLEKCDRIATLESRLTSTPDQQQLLSELQTRIRELEQERDSANNTASAKCDTLQRTVRELQKEIKQLYQDLNERSQKLEQLQTQSQSSDRIPASQKEDEQLSPPLPHNMRTRRSSSFDDKEVVDQSELLDLRERVRSQQKELVTLREAVKKTPNSIASNQETKAEKARDKSPMKTAVTDAKTDGKRRNPYEDDHATFAEPTEAEYLRNVLFRYMNERESLGKECVTLARVIGTVARFTPEQLTSVCLKEEQRTKGWYGGTIDTVNSVVGSPASFVHR